MRLRELLRWTFIHRERVRQYEDRIAHLTRMLEEPSFLRAEVDKARQTLEVECSHWSAAMLINSFAETLTRYGADNYVTLDMIHPDHGPFNVTIQKVNDKSPGQTIAELEEALAEAKFTIENLERDASIAANRIKHLRLIERQHEDEIDTYKETLRVTLEMIGRQSPYWNDDAVLARVASMIEETLNPKPVEEDTEKESEEE